MDNKLLLLPNITVAVRAKNILDKAGIKSFVQKTPRINNKTNCGYSLFVPDNAFLALDILRKYGINVIDVISRDQI